ncbi:MAG: hypothetical protein LBB05_01225 [Puniceicoccales bacterium]|jgi:hypothetical protein|nr:hypothetical protein [Puniceicoccales bacterium]
METIKKIIKFIIYVIFWILIVMSIKDFYERSSQNGKDIDEFSLAVIFYDNGTL